MARISSNTSYIAKGGIMTTISFILVYLSGIVPLNKTYLLTLSSFIIPLAVIATNEKTALLIYISTALISLLICGLRLTVLSYVIFFGLYGLVKYHIERLKKLPMEIILKLIYLNLCLAILFLIYTLFFPSLFKIKINLYLMITVVQIVFLIYDYLLTLFVSYIGKYVLKSLK